MQKWRLLISGYADGFRNMAIDEAILLACRRGLVPPTVRFYGWRPPGLSLGQLQRIDGQINLEACKRLGVDLVRRPTGGGAVLHDQELTYSVVCTEDNPIFPPDVLGTYKVIASCLVAGFRRLGLEAEVVSFREKRRNSDAGSTRGAPAVCFSAPSWYEITIEGKKVCGSAQRRIPGAFLQHGSIPLNLDLEMLSRLFIPRHGDRGRLLAHLRRTVTSLNQHLQEKVNVNFVQEVLIDSFQRVLEVELVESKLTFEEEELVKEGLRERYLDPRWNLGEVGFIKTNEGGNLWSFPAN